MPRLDDSEGYSSRNTSAAREAGHIALVSAGEIYPLVTNQEYKRAFDGNLGVVAGAPLGGLVERDPEDRYGLVRELLRPLQPWFRAEWITDGPRAGHRNPTREPLARHRVQRAPRRRRAAR
jgi:hypothetical protein